MHIIKMRLSMGADQSASVQLKLNIHHLKKLVVIALKESVQH